MLKTGLAFTKRSVSAPATAFELENVAFHNLKIAHVRSVEDPENIFKAKAFHRAIDNYHRIVKEHERMGF